jgi:hypothetical protein
MRLAVIGRSWRVCEWVEMGNKLARKQWVWLGSKEVVGQNGRTDVHEYSERPDESPLPAVLEVAGMPLIVVFWAALAQSDGRRVPRGASECSLQ